MDANTPNLTNARERRYKLFYQIVDEVVEDIQSHRWADTGKPKRRLKGNHLQMLRASVETLIRDSVAVVYQRKRKGEVGIHLNKNWYSSSISPADLTYSIHVQRAYQGMLELSYLEQTKKGVYNRQGGKDSWRDNRLTRYRATDRLIDKFSVEEQGILPVIVPPEAINAPIRVRVKTADGNRKALSAPETGEAGLMEWNLEQINRTLARFWYDLEVPDNELADLQARLADDPENERPLALHQCRLYRVFNDEELTTGGRFYGGWWQSVPKAYRRNILVNGKSMVEVDYSNLHPAILYSEAGITAPDDCYRGIFDQATELRHGDELRSMVKTALNAMLNAEERLDQAPRGIIDPARFGMKWREVSNAILAAHAPIADRFYTGVGKRLQRVDSDVAEQLLLDITGREIAILPIHDSFLVHEAWGSLLHERMLAALENVCGVKTALKAIPPDISRALDKLKQKQDQAIDDLDIETTQDLEKIYASYEGYDRRLEAFHSRLSSPQGVSG